MKAWLVTSTFGEESFKREPLRKRVVAGPLGASLALRWGRFFAQAVSPLKAASTSEAVLMFLKEKHPLFPSHKLPWGNNTKTPRSWLGV